jgi:hypothetical protein
MKRMSNFLVITGLLLWSCNETEKKSTASATEIVTESNTVTTAETAPAAPMDSATIAKNWGAYMTPSDVHKMMASWNGKWNGTVTMWQSPGATPEISQESTTNSMLMGGRYQQGIHVGTMMGQPFEGRSLLAYDNAKRTFTSTWIDNMGTGVMVVEGPWDETTKSMTLKGMVVDPSAGTGKEVPVREVFKIIDEKTHLMEMYGNGPDGKEFKMMEIKYNRK